MQKLEEMAGPLLQSALTQVHIPDDVWISGFCGWERCADIVLLFFPTQCIVTGTPSPGTESDIPGPLPVKYRLGAGEMGQWVKVFAAKPTNVSLIPRSHMAEGEREPTFLTSIYSLCLPSSR